ncbi:MAG: TonB-dependent receptor [Proteobacteria bacterium]|nr:TonB-dependent receptor [Pseudomonadota bacterium]
MRKQLFLFLTFVLATTGWQTIQAAEGDAIEEIVVTGSYLKRDAANSPSPLSVISSADIEDIGAADVGEIVQNMPWASGSQTRAATFQGEGADGRMSVNLRNLGLGSTLPLINGKRQVASFYDGGGTASVNVNGIVPNIALERIEVVKDGASALYGSDAIAGVVNFITKSDFEGFDFSYQFTTSDETSTGDTHDIELIWGVQGDRGGIVVSASNLDREEIHVGDNFERYGGTTVSGTGQPGRLIPLAPAVWAANGLRPGQPVTTAIDGGSLPRDALGNGGRLGAAGFGQADVNCEDAAALEQAGPLGPLFGNNLCIYDYGPFFAIQGEEKLRKIHIDGHYDFTDQVEFYFELAANQAEFNRKNSLNPNAPALPIPTQTSYIDGAGVIQTALNPGSQEDAFRRGIEPIRYANITRLIGGTRDTDPRYRPLDTFTNTDRTDARYMFGVDWEFEMGDRQWNMDASFTSSYHNSATIQVQDTLSTHMELALNGYGGPECNQAGRGTPGDGNAGYQASGGDFAAGSCYFFNPFGSSQFAADGSQYDIGNLSPGDPALALINPPELYTWLLGKANSKTQFEQTVIDLVFAGDLFDLGDQTAGLAFGYQRRIEKGETFLDSSLTSDNLDFVFGARPWKGQATTDAFFAELALPIGSTLEVNLAVRYETFDEIGEDTTDPKVTVLWQPLDGLSLRGSWGTSFRTPSLLQSFGTLTTVANEVDVSGESTFKPSLTVGNPNLVPETAENWGVGVSWIPQDGFLEGFQIDVDYFAYEYEDIIVRQPSNNLLSADNAALQAYRVANQPACGTDRDCWIAGMNAGVGNRAQVIRNAQAILLRILPEFENASRADVSGIDLNVSYTFDTGIGNFRVGAQSSWMEEYEVEDKNGRIFDAVGNYNQTNPVARPLPEWRINGTLNWNWENHRAFLIVRYVDELETDVAAGTRGFFSATARLAGNNSVADDLLDTKIESMTTADIQYTYSFGEVGLLADSAVSLGIMNFTNEEAPAIALVTAYDGRLHDGRGRMWFLRLQGSM